MKVRPFHISLAPPVYTGGVAESWNADLYQKKHSFVWEFGRDLLALLDPHPGERILDVGCGTGQLTAEIARAGAEVTGIDSSAAMVAQARGNFPDLRFETQDVCALAFDQEFDAIFSNAVLHWVTRAEDAIAAMSRALKPGGRFVVELGGHGNVAALMDASDRALHALGVANPEQCHPWFYPSVGEYAGLLERHGLEVEFAMLFDRPTPLQGGDEAIPNWFRMFGARLTEPLAREQMADYFRLAREYAAPALRRENGWIADYRRLRIAARKSH
jgi:trans-aconitate methyltransferase